MGVVEPRNVSRRNRRAWWARFTFNGITRYKQGAIDGANLIRPFSREQERFLEAHRQVLRR
jgi:hypothetical protein